MSSTAIPIAMQAISNVAKSSGIFMIPMRPSVIIIGRRLGTMERAPSLRLLRTKSIMMKIITPAAL